MGGYTSAPGGSGQVNDLAVQLVNLAVHLNPHVLGDGIRCCLRLVRGCRLHERLCPHLADAELNQPPVPGRVATWSRRGLRIEPRSTAHADPHHDAANPALAPAAAAVDRDVLPNLLAGFGVIDPLGVVARLVSDDVRPLAERATHGVVA